MLNTMADAQKAALKRARTMMNNLEYKEAIRVYNKILQKRDNAEAKINIAEAYRKIDDSENAEYWFGQVVILPEAQPIHQLFYGEALQKNGKCGQAKEYFKRYNEAVPGDMRGKQLAIACDLQDDLMNKNGDIYTIESLPFNSNLDDFGPTFYKGSLVFASERDKGYAIKREHSWTGLPFLDLFQVDSKDLNSKTCSELSFGKPKKFNNTLNSKYHDAAVSFNNDYSEIYFTRNNYLTGKTGKSDENIVNLKIYSAKSEGDGWGTQESLPFNSDEYSVAHPALSSDGNTLYFSSNMPGGYGGMDLYKSVKENGRWSPPVNLGSEINTEGNELFPVWHISNKLYFSSDGHSGLGGLDIYSVSAQPDGSLGLIENVGFPLNTSSDDFGMIISEDGLCGYLSSDREGGLGRDDIYYFKKTASPLEVLVYDEVTGLPIEGAIVKSSCRNIARTTNKEGLAYFDIKIAECCDLTVDKDLYTQKIVKACSKDAILGDKVLSKIPLKKKKQYNLEGVVFDQSTGLPMQGASVYLTNYCNSTLNTNTLSDAEGRFSFNVDENCCYKVKGEKLDYLSDSNDSLCAVNLPDDAKLIGNLYLQPTVGNAITSNPQKVVKDPATGKYINPDIGKPFTGVVNGIAYKDGKITGKSTMFEPSKYTNADGQPVAYILDIYYDFDKYDIREEAIPELEKLLNMLNENNKLIIELCSFTDARGSVRYNKKLSQNRAQAVVNWLVEKGISKDRLIPKGFGETRTTNGCVEAVKCDEQQHQMNRRTEFKIVGCKGCKDPKEKKISKPNDKTKVDPCPNCPF